MNAPARRIGVQANMTRAQLDPFVGLQTLTASDKSESNARQALLEALATFTPAIEPLTALGSAYRLLLDVTGTSLLWGDARQTLRRVVMSVRNVRMTLRMAVSSNAEASLCLASVAQREPIIVAPGKEAEALAALPLSTLALTAGQAETFALWGLRTLGELASLPVNAIVARMGQEGKRLHSIANGTSIHLLQPQKAPLQLDEAIEFESPIDDLDSLLFVLGPMLDQLIRRAMERACALASVTCTLVLDGGGEHARTVRPALATSDRKALLKLIQLDMQTHPPSAGILMVQVHAEVGERSQVQTGLFSPQLPEPMRLDVTLARIAALVGDDRVGRARLLDTHDCERGFVMERFTVRAGVRADDATNSSEPFPAPVLRKCRPPVELRVEMQGKEVSTRPRSFYLRAELYLIQNAHGPWRQSGNWWSADVWSHEEWDIQAHSKSTNKTLLAVLRHDLLRSQWTLEALYD